MDNDRADVADLLLQRADEQVLVSRILNWRFIFQMLLRRLRGDGGHESAGPP